jgi:DNA-binding helix-hairpin-helix protein with protein kinase domain
MPNIAYRRRFTQKNLKNGLVKWRIAIQSGDLMQISLDQAVPHIVQHGLFLRLELAWIRRVNRSKRERSQVRYRRGAVRRWK